MEDEPKIRITLGYGRKTKLCPTCLDPLRKDDSASSLSGWLTPTQYSCPSCGYVGSIAVEPKDFKQSH